MSLSIALVDPADAAAYDDFYAVYAAALRHGPVGPHVPVWQHAEVLASMVDPDPRQFRLGWLARLDGVAVATGWMHGSVVDNTDVVDVVVCVDPAHRGRGHGRAVLEHLEDEARSRGRSRVLAEVSWEYADATGTASSDLAWARRNGFSVGLVDVQRELALPVPSATLDALAPDVAPYELVSFVGPVPDELAEGWAALDASLMTEAPTGDIAREPETASVEGLRAGEALVEAQGRTKVNTCALSPDGEVVAYTDVALSVHESDRAYQWGTLVRADHRGHRLGMAVKVANLRLVQATDPGVRTVITFNAEVNAHMVGVNEALGFVPVLRMGELEKKL
jgi:GNAT superfamily N-acetyltransferase/RimJ/RimL family protein N-acetyltransferase